MTRPGVAGRIGGGRLARRRTASPFPSRTERMLARLWSRDNEHALLASEEDLFHLVVVPEQHGIVASLFVAVFPATLRLGHDFGIALHGDLGAVNEQAIFAGAEFGGSQLGGLGDVDVLADGLGHCG